MNVREKLIELIIDAKRTDTEKGSFTEYIAEYLIYRGVTVQECACWQYIEDDIDEDNNIKAYRRLTMANEKRLIDANKLIDFIDIRGLTDVFVSIIILMRRKIHDIPYIINLWNMCYFIYFVDSLADMSAK